MMSLMSETKFIELGRDFFHGEKRYRGTTILITVEVGFCVQILAWGGIYFIYSNFQHAPTVPQQITGMAEFNFWASLMGATKVTNKFIYNGNFDEFLLHFFRVMARNGHICHFEAKNGYTWSLYG